MITPTPSSFTSHFLSPFKWNWERERVCGHKGLYKASSKHDFVSILFWTSNIILCSLNNPFISIAAGTIVTVLGGEKCVCVCGGGGGGGGGGSASSQQCTRPLALGWMPQIYLLKSVIPSSHFEAFLEARYSKNRLLVFAFEFKI